MDDIVILSGARTAIGTFGGALAGVPPITLGATAAKAALERAGVDGAQIGHVAYGHVINTEPRDMYLSRVASMEAGVPDTTPAMNVNRLCGSGAQAIVSVIQSLALGDAEYGLAGGAESMSRGPHILPEARWGQKMGDVRALDMMIGALHCPFGTGHMGVTAENVASEHQITRDDQDGFALESQKRAARAIEEGRFKEQIVPVAGEGETRHGRFRHRRASQGHHGRGAGGSEDGLQEGRHRHGGQRQRHQRRGGGHRAGARRCRREGRADAARADPGLRPCRRSARGHGDRPGARGAEALWSVSASRSAIST
jgi:acetyl-CoA acetyltransferase